MMDKIPLEVRPEGLYCTAGDFFIDAWHSVPRCVVTHGHGDHARWGHQHYIAAEGSLEILKHRLGAHISIQTLKYGQRLKIGECWLSLHPAGHILGSAQVRIETTKGVFVISGDYKRAPDATCEPFEVVECDLFVTESTFALPVYKWEQNAVVAQQIMRWWHDNQQENHPSILFCYALGKAQRIMSLLASYTQQPVYVHGAIFPLAQIYAQQGVTMLPFHTIGDKLKGESFAKELILAPPSAAGSPWLKRFPSFRTAAASGWMQIRGMRRRKGMDHGFVLSDHADWDALIETIAQTKATRVLTTHGNAATLAKYLREEKNLHAQELKGLGAVDEDED